MNTHDIELPQGYAERPFDYSGDLYTEGQVRAIVEADRKRRGEPVACFKCGHAKHGGECVNVAPQPVEPDKQHPDNVAVDAFAAAMKAKLKRAREEKGRGGWQDMSATKLSAMLREHVEKSDPVDVANLAMMLHQNGQVIEPPATVVTDEMVEALRAEVERLRSMTAVTVGVGSGDGNLFVHGDYDSIKAVQSLVFRAEGKEK